MHMHIGTWSSLHDLAKMVRGAVLAVYTLYVVYTNPTSSYVIMDGYYNLYYAVSILTLLFYTDNSYFTLQ